MENYRCIPAIQIETTKLKDIDYVLISHSHYDHCDKESLKTIQRQNPDAVFLAGLNMKSLLTKLVGNNKIQEAGWYQQFQLDNDIEISFLPARHSSRRSINDVNERLWGAFVIKSKEKTIYYGGHSGYGSHYKEAGTLFPNIVVALIGVGAYCAHVDNSYLLISSLARNSKPLIAPLAKYRLVD